jgi:gliding motility-associated-like protein
MPLNSVKILPKPQTILFAMLTSLLMGVGGKAYAQLCTGSLGDPVVKIDFGTGTSLHAGPLPTGTTNYTYSTDDFPIDGSYTVESRTTGNIWWNTTDHTGNGGYMMVVNASQAKTDYFYKTTVTGLCPGTTFEFAAWVANLLRTNDISPPNITFTISTTDGTILKTYNTGDIALTPGGLIWKQIGTYFTTPAGVSDVVIQMTNNSNGGAPANDLALDDITFRPCGPMLTARFDLNGGGSITQLVCSGASQAMNLKAEVAAGGYTNPVYQWQQNTGFGWTNISGATSTSYTVTPTAVGTYKYRLISSEAANSGSAGCQAASNELTLTINPQPTAAFIATQDYTLSCISKQVNFTDNSTPPAAVTERTWDFGDGQISHLPNPSHTFSGFGKYNVTLTVSGAGGCQSTITQVVEVIPKIVADFAVQTQSCPNQPVAFTDKSTIIDGTIKQWIWTFGDGSPAETYPDNRQITHTYTKAGKFTATLDVVSSTSCVSDIMPKSINVLPVDTPRFKLPDVCQADQFAQFTDTTHFTNGNTGYTYLWNFGDALATAASPNTSSLQNPAHHYSQAGVYQVSLTLTAPSGCSLTTTSSFTINGANPVADFSVSQPICASDSAVLTNKSTVDFGNVSRLEIFWDYDNAPTASSVYIRSAKQIPADNLFKHLYSVPVGQISKTYHIRMIASSGEICGNTRDANIVVNASPIVSLTPLNTVCIESGKQQIIENKNGFTGTGIFSGTGVSSTGLFDPQAAGLGTHTIHYIFTAQSGCNYADSMQVSVYKSPVVNLVPTATALEGGSIIVNPKAAGDSLTFKWSPATGISNPNILNPVFSPTVTTTYTLTVTTSGGCSGVAQVVISVLKTPVIPNAFTPNGDGVNDTWEIKYLDIYPDATVDVFNRYGAKVYTSIGYAVPWDGKNNGKQLPFGVYYYVIHPKSGRSAMAGSVTIVK